MFDLPDLVGCVRDVDVVRVHVLVEPLRDLVFVAVHICKTEKL